MNRVINLTIWVIALLVIGGLIAREYGIYMKNSVIADCTPLDQVTYDNDILKYETDLASYKKS